MNNYQHHEKAQQLAEAHSAYELARRVVELESARGEADGFESQRLAIGFCQSRNYKDGSKEWRQASDAFSEGYHHGRLSAPSAPAAVPVDPWVLYDPDTNQIKMDPNTGCWCVFEEEPQALRAMLDNPGTEYKQAKWFRAAPQPKETGE